MTDHATTPAEEKTPFSKADVRHFEAEDAEAGNAIGKMLSLFFFYTVIVMTLSSVVTYWWIFVPHGE